MDRSRLIKHRCSRGLPSSRDRFNRDITLTPNVNTSNTSEVGLRPVHHVTSCSSNLDLQTELFAFRTTFLLGAVDFLNTRIIDFPADEAELLSRIAVGRALLDNLEVHIEPDSVLTDHTIKVVVTECHCVAPRNTSAKRYSAVFSELSTPAHIANHPDVISSNFTTHVVTSISPTSRCGTMMLEHIPRYGYINAKPVVSVAVSVTKNTPTPLSSELRIHLRLVADVTSTFVDSRINATSQILSLDSRSSQIDIMETVFDVVTRGSSFTFRCKSVLSIRNRRLARRFLHHIGRYDLVDRYDALLNSI